MKYLLLKETLLLRVFGKEEVRRENVSRGQCPSRKHILVLVLNFFC